MSLSPSSHPASTAVPAAVVCHSPHSPGAGLPPHCPIRMQLLLGLDSSGSIVAAVGAGQRMMMCRVTMPLAAKAVASSPFLPRQSWGALRVPPGVSRLEI